MSSSGPPSDNGLGAPCRCGGGGTSFAQLDLRGKCPGVRLSDGVQNGVGVVGKDECEEPRLEGTFSFLTQSRLEATDPRERADRDILRL